MAMVDSMDKVVGTYFTAVTRQPFTYKNRVYAPKPLYVAPSFFHEYRCVLNCGGCCPRFSLDYLPTDPRPESLTARRSVIVNGKEIQIFSHVQKPEASATHCDHYQEGVCKIHGLQPFSCDFETLRFVHFKDKTWLGVRPFGRGWNMLRGDGKRGALCEFPRVPTEFAKLEGIRKLKRLKEWTDAFELPTYLPEVIAWASSIVPGETSIPQIFTVIK